MTRTEFDDVVSKQKSAPPLATDDVDLEAWLNDDTSAVTSSSLPSSGKDRQDSWNDWEEVGWGAPDGGDDDVAVTSSKRD